MVASEAISLLPDYIAPHYLENDYQFSSKPQTGKLHYADTIDLAIA